MGDMQFQTDDQNEFGAPQSFADKPGVTGKLVEWGLASSVQQAEYILITVGAVCILIAGYFFFFSGGSSIPVQPVYGNPDAPVQLVQ
ncbi:hypothetical protein A2763_00590 [Candidatus Kaiserbacteria bacterium RIFCSPHIGHO2_01_FULL_54_36]|uniref:Uncharacterized protein n=1 Tax=Candidatus Kaiserbacteria bacterium RIFCSPHIGHO2_01_FULL_54_36 TaxID=1798482 RepID=A0A1F6CPN6_9BACT|nr:MAG: hypothetical protein A2763_00590 [Candidatus Kaiserbacteria bacterium RIFCSPHIGHO2_01_FULL_54_36]OGG75529.1 MAG: hypothetical protein A3A41_02795 [Candidatus Kaiserbacteria bacterium RIFCSPLOWO2_01_FULL_54_22]